MLLLLSEVANIFGDHLDVATLEVGAFRNLADIYRDGGTLPQLILVVDGVPRGRLTGARRRREIAAFLSRHVGPDALIFAPPILVGVAARQEGHHIRRAATASPACDSR